MNRKGELTYLIIENLKPLPDRRDHRLDTKVPGLRINVYASGKKVWYFVYSRWGRKVPYWIGDYTAVGLADARKEAKRLALEVAMGRDPQADRRATRTADTFARVYERYLEEYAKRFNKKWEYTDKNYIRRFVLPLWADRPITSITRKDVRALHASISRDRPITANMIVGAASAVFSWAIKQEIVTANPCKLIDMNPTNERDRVLSDSEIALFMKEFDQLGLVEGTALKLMLLTGQRGNEIRHMRWEHIRDGWWEMPGKPDPNLGWPGTKTGVSNRVWLPAEARKLIANLRDGNPTAGYVFKTNRGRPVIALSKFTLAINKRLEIAVPFTAHDLRRTFASRVTGCGFRGEDADRLLNHAMPRISRTYNRHDYADRDKQIFETVANHIMNLVSGRRDDNVVAAEFRK
jgi:integrase